MEAEGSRSILAYNAAAALVSIDKESAETISTGLSRITIPSKPSRSAVGADVAALTIPGAAPATEIAEAAEAVSEITTPPSYTPSLPPIIAEGVVVGVSDGKASAGDGKYDRVQRFGPRLVPLLISTRVLGRTCARDLYSQVCLRPTEWRRAQTRHW